MALYRVRWEIDMDAKTAREAAKQALATQRDIRSIATIFDVRQGDGKWRRVDLQPKHASPESPAQSQQDRSCAVRITDRLENRMELIKEACGGQEKREELLSLVFDCDRSWVYKVVLSTGGPADGFRLFVNPKERIITRAFYWFRDGFDGAEVEVFGEDFEMVCGAFGWVAEMAD